MPEDVREELVHVRSGEGYRLDGVLMKPPSEGAIKSLGVICVPGLYATFHEPPYIELGRGLARLGYACIVVGDRGSGFGAVLRGEDGVPVCGGGGWERPEVSSMDVERWIEFATEQGREEVALLGHSFGARKVAYYQARSRAPSVSGLVAASPVARRLSPPDADLFALAKEMVSGGRGRDLLPWPETGCSMSAQTYLDHEDPEATFLNVFERNTLRAPDPVIARVYCPILAFYGSEEMVEGATEQPSWTSYTATHARPLAWTRRSSRAPDTCTRAGSERWRRSWGAGWTACAGKGRRRGAMRPPPILV